MISHRKKIKFKESLSKVFEPIALGILALVFIIPTLTVINLEPITKDLKDFNNVLGVNTQNKVNVNLFGGTHEIVTSEKVYRDRDGGYIYEAKLAKRNADFYSKPILRVVNSTNEDKELSFLGSTLNPSKTEIGLIINNQSYTLQEKDGESQIVSVLIRPDVIYDIYLTVDSSVSVQFTEDFGMNLAIQ
jgi:hypothetical protein